jgi:hypothetical protein
VWNKKEKCAFEQKKQRKSARNRRLTNFKPQMVEIGGFFFYDNGEVMK